MNREQIAAYRSASAAMRDAELGRTNRDQDLIDSHNRAVASGLRVLRDADHEQALLDLMADNTDAPEHVRTVAGIMATKVGVRYLAVATDRAAAELEYRKVLAGRRLDSPCLCGSGMAFGDCTEHVEHGA